MLAGDVMTGRGLDQVLAHPGPSELREQYVDDARVYVELAEQANGPIPAPVPPSWPWGDVLRALPEGFWRVMNLETSVTRSDDWAPRKGVHYRMSPDNVDCLHAAGVDVWTLANNHVLDFGARGLVETLDVLRAGGLATAGAGRDAEEAWRPAVLSGPDGRLVVWSVADTSSGVPSGWAAGVRRPGVALLPRLDEATAAWLASRVEEVRRPGDLLVVSVHWGPNWGYAVPPGMRRFARRLLEAGVQVVHGHSSHHPRPAELHAGGVALYGCGDLVNDYEGIAGHEQFRGELRLLHAVTLGLAARVAEVRAVPVRPRRMRLERATPEEARWRAETLTEHGRAVGSRVDLAEDGTLRLTAREPGTIAPSD